MTSDCKFISICEILSRGILPKVKYQTYFSSECWMEILSTEQKMLGGNNFHPASTRYSTHWKLGYSSTSKAVVRLHLYLWIFFNIYINQNITIPSTNGRIKLSFRARGHVGWWVEFHLVSLSEGRIDQSHKPHNALVPYPTTKFYMKLLSKT